MLYCVWKAAVFYIPYSKKIDRRNFDGYWLFKYLTENTVMDGYCLSPYTCKCCIVFKQFHGLNFDNLAGKHPKHQNFPHQNFPLYGIAHPKQRLTTRCCRCICGNIGCLDILTRFTKYKHAICYKCGFYHRIHWIESATTTTSKLPSMYICQ